MAGKSKRKKSGARASVKKQNIQTTSKNKNVFPFFRLARELRDLIYDELLEHTRTKLDTGTRLDCWSIDKAPRYTAICKQFHEEAMERRQNQVELEINDRSTYTFQAPSLSPVLLKTTTLTVRLVCGRGELRAHQRWLSDLLTKMPNLKSTRVIIRSVMESSSEVLSELPTSEFWINIPGLSELQVSGRYAAMHDRLLWDFGEPPEGLVLKWNAELKKLELPEDSSAE